MSHRVSVGPRRLTVWSFLLGPLGLATRAPVWALILLAAAAALTVLTQTSGILLWIGTPLLARIRDRFARAGARFAGAGFATVVFVIAYLINALAVAPGLAALAERVPLPCGGGDALVQPATKWTCLLSRHYVTPALKSKLEALGAAMVRRNGPVPVYYLDAGFPFGFGLPMLPHLSHRDGRAVDLAFAYQTEVDGAFLPSAPPSPIGYWKYETPSAEELRPCAGRVTPLRWDLPWLQGWFADTAMDPARTRVMIAWLLADRQPPVRRIFLEPHLAHRLELSDARLRFQGCDAARHDDHLHVEL